MLRRSSVVSVRGVVPTGAEGMSLTMKQRIGYGERPEAMTQAEMDELAGGPVEPFPNRQGPWAVSAPPIFYICGEPGGELPVRFRGAVSGCARTFCGTRYSPSG